MFELDPRLAADSALACRIGGCQLRAVDDARFAWLLLVPERAGLSELHDLSGDDAAALLRLAVRLGQALKAATGADKVNTAAIGNAVAQLHVHIVARRRDDAAWPRPVWGNGAPVRLAPDAMAARLALVRALAAALGPSAPPSAVA